MLSQRGEVSIFIRELKILPLEHQAIYTLLLTTGLRRGERYGLQWKDINFENHIISIERNVTYTSKNGVTIGLPKTTAGIRKIPLTNHATALLKEYKAELSLQYTLSDNMFVFPSTESPYKPHGPDIYN